MAGAPAAGAVRRGEARGFLLLPKLRQQVIQTSHRLHQMGWVANHDGNVSVRLRGDRLLITATALSKRDIDDASLLVVDMQGRVLEGRKRPFSELALHIACYRARPEVNVVLHSHAPIATAFGLTGRELAPIAIPEIVVSLGDRIPTVPRRMPKDPEGPDLVAQYAAAFDAFLVAGNGVFTVGDDLTQALLRMELVEHYARILHAAATLGPVEPLAQKDVDALLEARRKAGLGVRSS